MADTQQTISVPSLILIAALGAFAVRYFFFAPSDPSSRSRSSRSRPANPNDVQQVATMFPQIPRREITWDLQRNGGNVAGTTERILSQGRLDPPPPTFQPIVPDPTTGSAASIPKPEHLDLIQKYNLSGKVQGQASTSEQSAASSQQNWSSDKQERQALFQRRREEMILNARRKMEEKERAQGMR